MRMSVGESMTAHGENYKLIMGGGGGEPGATAVRNRAALLPVTHGPVSQRARKCAPIHCLLA